MTVYPSPLRMASAAPRARLPTKTTSATSPLAGVRLPHPTLTLGLTLSLNLALTVVLVLTGTVTLTLTLGKYISSDEDTIKSELVTSGSISAVFEVFSDFFT